MKNLYVFAIGGSGERVLSSLVMMLAAGMPIRAEKIIPVFVDNDENSKALANCRDLIKYYRSDSKDLVGLHKLCQTSGEGDDKATFACADVAEPVALNIPGGAIRNLESIIIGQSGNDTGDSKSIRESIEEEKELLFTEDDLELPLNVGFVGNPNVGSIVLNTLSLQKQEFKEIYGKVDEKDGVFVIGSLFGGTGAAGFPLIVNTFYKKGETRPLIGGVAVLPYFNTIQQKQDNNGEAQDSSQRRSQINTERWNVDSDTFESKTRAALMYYADYMDNMDYMYYVGDDAHRSMYPHSVGGKTQGNPYNIIEVMAALSVINFSQNTERPDKIVYQMPVWDFITDGNSPDFANVSCIKNKKLKEALVRFQIMEELFRSPAFLEEDIKQNVEYVADIKFDKGMLEAVRKDECKNNYKEAAALRFFFKEWDRWLKELNNDPVARKFRIFNSGALSTRKNITELFYTNDQDADGIPHGIAKTKRVGVFSKKDQAIPLAIEDDMLEIFRNLGNAAAISRPQALSTLIFVISKALDKAIKNKCNL